MPRISLPLVASCFAIALAPESKAGGIVYPLDAFRTTDLVQNTLTIQGRLGSSSRAVSIEQNANDHDTSSWAVSGSTSAAFTRTVDRPSVQRFFSVGVELRPNFSGSSDESTVDHPTQNNPSQDIDRSHRDFLSRESVSLSDRRYVSGRFFGELKGSVSHSWEYNRQTSDVDFSSDPPPPTDEVHEWSKATRTQLLASGTAGVGYGRIYSIVDVRTGLYILDELQDAGLLLTTPDAATVERFGNRIREILNDRVFDSREERIHEMREIVRFLQEERLVGDLDVEGFSIIDDNFRLGDRTERGTGQEVGLAFSARWTDDGLDQRATRSAPNFRSHRETDSDTDALIGEIYYVRSHPISKTMQLSHTAGAQYADMSRKSTIVNRRRDDAGSDEERRVDQRDTSELGATITNSLDLYPNSRDLLRLATSASFDRHDFDNKEHPKWHAETVSLLGLVGWTHYLSMRTTLSAGLSLRYRHEKQRHNPEPRANSTGQEYGHDFSVSMQHYVF